MSGYTAHMTPYSAGQAAALRKYAGSALGAGIGAGLGVGASALGVHPLIAVPAGAAAGGLLGNHAAGDEEKTPVGASLGGGLGALGGGVAGGIGGGLVGSLFSPMYRASSRPAGLSMESLRALIPIANGILAGGAIGSVGGAALGSRVGHRAARSDEKKKDEAGEV